MAGFTIQAVLLSTQQEHRYPKNEKLQFQWRCRVEGEIKKCDEQIEFFKKLAIRNIWRKNICEGANDSVAILKKRKAYLTESLAKGDYIDTAT